MGEALQAVKSFHLKIADHEEGAYDESQIAQMFADGRIDRNTPCKPADRGDWKSVDDYLPILKYGTQLPPRTENRAVPPMPPPVLSSQLSQRISIVDFDIPFWSVLKIMFKWMAAGLIVILCLMPVVIFIWLVVAAIFAALLSGAMSTWQHP